MLSCAIQIISTSYVNSFYCICLGFEHQVCFMFLSLKDTSHLEDMLVPYYFVYYFTRSFCICAQTAVAICAKSHDQLKQNHPTVNDFCAMSLLISNRFLTVGWLGPRVNAYVVWLDISTAFSVGNR